MKRDMQIRPMRHDGYELVPTARQRSNRDPRTESFGNAAPDFTKVKSEVLTLVPQTRYRSLLVPVDGTAFSEHALPLALALARRSQATLCLVHVHAPLAALNPLEKLDYVKGSDVWQKLRQKRYLANLVERLAKVSSVPVTTAFIEGRRIPETLSKAVSATADLVVMATHQSGPWQRFWHGSIANALRRRLSTPIVFVGGSDTTPDLANEPRLRRVLLPLDGTPFAEQILEPAQTLSNVVDAEQTLLRVLAPSATGSYEDEARYLQDVAKRFGGPLLGIHPQLMLSRRSTAKAILNFAKEQEVDLIALATHGRGGLSRFVHGSVAERVVRGASVPVLMYRPRSEAVEKGE
jgi:nucleotide-binding universal stress UspA family protein